MNDKSLRAFCLTCAEFLRGIESIAFQSERWFSRYEACLSELEAAQGFMTSKQPPIRDDIPTYSVRMYHHDSIGDQCCKLKKNVAKLLGFSKTLEEWDNAVRRHVLRSFNYSFTEDDAPLTIVPLVRKIDEALRHQGDVLDSVVASQFEKLPDPYRQAINQLGGDGAFARLVFNFSAAHTLAHFGLMEHFKDFVQWSENENEWRDSRWERIGSEIPPDLTVEKEMPSKLDELKATLYIDYLMRLMEDEVDHRIHFSSEWICGQCQDDADLISEVIDELNQHPTDENKDWLSRVRVIQKLEARSRISNTDDEEQSKPGKYHKRLAELKSLKEQCEEEKETPADNLIKKVGNWFTRDWDKVPKFGKAKWHQCDESFTEEERAEIISFKSYFEQKWNL